MKVEDLLLEFIDKFGMSKGLFLILALQLLNLIKGIKFNHFKEIFQEFINKERKELKAENTTLTLQLKTVTQNYDAIVRLNKRSNAIYKVLNVFRDKFNLGYVNIWEYHNGISNLALDCMFKYTMTYTVYHPFGFDLKHEHESQSLTKFSDIIGIMLENGVFDTDIKDFTISRNYRIKLGLEREISYFLKDNTTDIIFGAITISLLEGYDKAIEYKKELLEVKKEIEDIYKTYRNENIE